MNVMGIVIALIIGAVAGWLAGFIMGGKGGLIRNIIMGIIGGIAGTFLLNLLGFSASGGIVAQILVAVFGACVLIAVGRFLFK
ncbi:MAG: GlsB/YeaQ/YmgE family stress response membrane protein [Neisseriaceae bacterium]|nr:GlsB/YeaQ/YmgE family stress response membrane protein [Neisseriaceae bacterium]